MLHLAEDACPGAWLCICMLHLVILRILSTGWKTICFRTTRHRPTLRKVYAGAVAVVSRLDHSPIKLQTLFCDYKVSTVQLS